ncbi:MAG: 1,4-beta-xylanase, partial [Eubacteriales bacterium]
VKSEAHPETIIMLRSRDPLGPFERISRFDEEMNKLEQGKYEAPAAFRLPDGRWCLLLDYYGVPGKGQGYVPFVAESLDSGAFIRSGGGFSFPYGFKHGTVLEISEETCQALESLVLDD